MLIIHGTRDQASNITDIYRYAGELDAADKYFEMKVYQGEGHGFMIVNGSLSTSFAAQNAFHEMADFFDRTLQVIKQSNRLPEMEKRIAHYIPGVCNIGRDEIRVRALTGLAGLFITAILLIILIIVRAPPVIRIVVSIPAFIIGTRFSPGLLSFLRLFRFEIALQFRESRHDPGGDLG